MRDIPAAFAPFEYLVGRWNGQGVPRDHPAKKFRGWTETHSWAWIFAKGKPVGLAVAIEGGKVLAAGKLTYDAEPASSIVWTVRSRSRADQSCSRGRSTSPASTWCSSESPPAEWSERRPQTAADSWPNANFIRYTMAHDVKEPGAFQFTRTIEVGLTRDGESLAGVASASERPKCIVTGGAANMTLTYQGRTFPICCTGCRDEFNENPEKYIKKASLMLGLQTGKTKSGHPAPSRVGPV